MTEYIKSQNAKIETVEYDWDSAEVETIGNGTPQGGGKIISLRISIFDNLLKKINSFGFSVQPDDINDPHSIQDMYTVNANYNYLMDKSSTYEKQVAFLKEHEQEMTEYIKSQKFYITTENEKLHPKVTKVTFDYENFEAYRRDAGGISYDCYTIDITGHYNGTEEFELLIDIDSLTKPTKILNFERY